MPLWAENEALIDLTDRMSAANLTTDLFYKAVNDQNLWKGKWYSFLYSMDGRVLYYRKDLFREAGLDPDSPPTHIDEIASAAEALTRKTGERYESIGFIPVGLPRPLGVHVGIQLGRGVHESRNT